MKRIKKKVQAMGCRFKGHLTKPPKGSVRHKMRTIMGMGLIQHGTGMKNQFRSGFVTYISLEEFWVMVHTEL